MTTTVSHAWLILKIWEGKWVSPVSFGVSNRALATPSAPIEGFEEAGVLGGGVDDEHLRGMAVDLGEGAPGNGKVSASAATAMGSRRTRRFRSQPATAAIPWRWCTSPGGQIRERAAPDVFVLDSYGGTGPGEGRLLRAQNRHQAIRPTDREVTTTGRDASTLRCSGSSTTAAPTAANAQSSGCSNAGRTPAWSNYPSKPPGSTHVWGATSPSSSKRSSPLATLLSSKGWSSARRPSDGATS